MPAVKTWIKALLIAGILELPQVVVLAGSIKDLGKSNLILNALGWYHVLAIWFGQYVLLVWNPGPRRGPTAISNSVAWLSVFGFQVLITTPITYGLLRWIGHLRAEKYSKRPTAALPGN